MALDNLIKKNLIKLDIEMSRKKGRNAKIYIPTFKGLLVFLANYPFPTGAIIDRSEDKKLIKIKARIPEKEKDKLDEILERNGKLLNFPLFEQIRALALHPRLYENFIEKAKLILSSPLRLQLSETEQRLVKDQKEIEKKIAKIEKMFGKDRFRSFRNGVEYPYDPTADDKEDLKNVESLLNIFNTKENEFLKESYFLSFFSLFPYTQNIPNKELYDYTLKLLEKKKIEFVKIEKHLEKGLKIFDSSVKKEGIKNEK